MRTITEKSTQDIARLLLLLCVVAKTILNKEQNMTQFGNPELDQALAPGSKIITSGWVGVLLLVLILRV